jgi:rRNA maturation RNase YbeY
MAIFFYTEHVRLPAKFPKRKLKAWICEIANNHAKTIDHINYIFCTDVQIRELNTEFLKHKYYTDILTFNYSKENNIDGEIYISIDTVKSNAKKFNTNLKEELYRVMIHGILHLCGINDLTVQDKEKMTQEENKALECLRIITDF